MKNTFVYRKLDARSAMADPPAQARVHHQPNAGFTLTELLVTISIVVILVTAGALTSLQMLSSAAEQHTRIILAAAKNIAEEYELQTGVKINHAFNASVSNPPFDWRSTVQHLPANAPPSLGEVKDCGEDPYLQGHTEGATSNAGKFQYASSERFVWAAYQMPSTRDLLTKLGNSVLMDENRNCYLELRDGWGNKIIYVEKVAHNNTDDPFRLVRYLPEHPRPYFASAGRDGIWADNLNVYNPNDQAAADNLYSFNID